MVEGDYTTVMRYFIDTEFIEDGSTIALLSIGVVAEDGREYYAQRFYRDGENSPYQRASDWVARNVFPGLTHFHVLGHRDCYQGHTSHGDKQDARCGFKREECPWRTLYQLREELITFMDPEKHGKPEVWGYYADYDWVVLCQLFGTMMDLPKGWPMYAHDIKQLCDELGNPQLPPEGKDEHHALADARWNKQAWEFLQALATLRV